MIRIAAEFSKYSRPVMEAMSQWQKKNKRSKMSEYEIRALGSDIFEQSGEKVDSKTLDRFVKMMKEHVLPGYGIGVTKGMHASESLVFASEEDALQYLADVSRSRVLVAKKWSGKVKPKWSPPEGLFTKGAETIANSLFKSSKTLKQGMSRLNFYINRAGDNLSEKDRNRLEHAKKLLREKFEE
jgi:hypothetical protein